MITLTQLSPKSKKLIFIATGILLVIIVLLLGIFATSPSESPKTTSISPTPSWQTYSEQVQRGQILPADKILEVTLRYKKDSNPAFDVVQLAQKNGYVPDIPDDPDLYTMGMYDQQGNLLFQTPFSIQLNEIRETFEPDGTIKGTSHTFTEVTIVVNLLWIDKATVINITDPQGKRLFTLPITDVVIVNNTPEFESFSEQTPQQEEKKESSSLFIKKVAAVAANSSAKTLDIAFISDDFTDMNDFRSEVTKATAIFTTTEPFKSRIEDLKFHTVQSSVDLECAFTSQIARLATCNNAVVKQQLNTKGVPYDQVIVLVNSPVYGGSGGEIAVVTKQGFAQNKAIFLHELGHSFGRLLDEYAYEGEAQNGVIDNNIHHFGTDSVGDGNCYAGNPPVADWEGMVTTADYRKGCSTLNWYSSSQTSIMKDSTSPSFNIVSQCIFNRRLDDITG